MKTEILKQVDKVINVAPNVEAFEYDSLGEDDSLQGRERQLHLSKRYDEQRKRYAERVGQVVFQKDKLSMKVLNDKQHLKNFKARINKEWKVKKPTSIKVKPLPSIKSCISRLIKDTDHRSDDSDSYHLNIFNAGELHPEIIFYGGGSDYITPYVIESKIKINDRNLVVVQGCTGWNVLDELTALSVVRHDQKVNKKTAIDFAMVNVEGFEFDHHRIKEYEITNTQENLKKRFCELNNIEVPMSFI